MPTHEGGAALYGLMSGLASFVAATVIGSGTVLATGEIPPAAPPAGPERKRIRPLVSQPKYLAPHFPPAKYLGAQGATKSVVGGTPFWFVY